MSSTTSLFSLRRWGLYLQSSGDEQIRRAVKPQETMPFGAHLEIGNYGDLSTLHWVENAPITGEDLNCEVTYGGDYFPSFTRFSFTNS